MKKVLTSTITSSEKSEYQIPVTWHMKSVLTVSADSLEDAIQLVKQQEYDLPQGEYVNDSYRLDYDILDGK